MNEPPNVDVRPVAEHELEAVVRIFTGPVANKRAFVAQSFACRSVVGAYREASLTGCIIWDRGFFGRAFIWLLGVDPALRRHGIGALLVRAFERANPAEPLFTSTNESNAPMHALLARNGFVRSGRVENLDPGDPEIFYFKRAAAAEK